MKASFLNCNFPILTSMVLADNPDRIKELMDKSLTEGAKAFGIQICKLKKEYRNKETYKDLFSHAKGMPVYVTNYRNGQNTGKTDDTLAEELIELAGCGATLCDVMGDLFDRQSDEMAKDEAAIKKQIALIDELHSVGAMVLMSSHIYKFTPAERVLEIAREQQRRGVDICKIVTGADTMAEQIENLRIITLLKENLDIPFLFLAGGECRILRRIGGEIGNCMDLCVCEHDEWSTPVQPLIRNVRAIRDNMSSEI